MRKSLDHWCVKNTKSEFVYMNSPLLMDLNVPNGYDFEGKLDKELPSKPTAEMWEEFVEHDRKVINENKSISAIEINCYGKGNTNISIPHLSKKSPLYNDKDEIVGLVCHARIIDSSTLLYYMNRLNRKTIQSDAPNGTFKKRKLEIIF